MAKTLQFTFDSKEYILEYTRKSVQRMEKNGFTISELDAKPMTLLPQLFTGAFFAHHPFTSQAEIDKIYEALENKRELIAKLAEMYADPINALVDDSEDNAGNISWTASF